MERVVVNLNMEKAEVSDPSVSSDWTTRASTFKRTLISRDDTSLLPHNSPTSPHSERQRAKIISDRQPPNNPNLRHLPDPKDAVAPPPPNTPRGRKHPVEHQMLPLT